MVHRPRACLIVLGVLVALARPAAAAKARAPRTTKQPAPRAPPRRRPPHRPSTSARRWPRCVQPISPTASRPSCGGSPFPSWLLNAFTKKNVPLSSWGTGLSVFRRKGNFDIALSFNYQNMSPPDGNWLGSSNNAATDVSFLQFQSFAMYGFDFSFLWHNYFTDWFGIHYGAGVGIGILGGHIDRTKNLNGDCTDANAGDPSMCTPAPTSMHRPPGRRAAGRPDLQRPARRRLPPPQGARLGGSPRRWLLRRLLPGRRHRVHVLACCESGPSASRARAPPRAATGRRRRDPVRRRRGPRPRESTLRSRAPSAAAARPASPAARASAPSGRP